MELTYTTLYTSCYTATVSDKYASSSIYITLSTGMVPIDMLPYSRKIWRGIKFGGLAVYYYNRQIKIRQNFLLAYIRMAIPYRTAKFKSANILSIAILGSTAKLMPANISGYTVLLLSSVRNPIYDYKHPLVLCLVCLHPPKKLSWRGYCSVVVISIEDEETVVMVLIEVVYIVIDESTERLCRKHNFIL